MKEFDAKTPEAIRNGDRYILPRFTNCEDATFKASYIVATDLVCAGKVTALFDLIVFGNVSARDIEVKGRFVCTGVCEVEDTIAVQNDIWAESIVANRIEAHDRIVVQDLDAKTVVAEGTILVGKTLAVEECAQSDLNVICGETAYGAGRVVANMIITGDPLDLDDGEDAVFLPNKYTPTAKTIDVSANIASEVLHSKDAKTVREKIEGYVAQNDFVNYLDLLQFLVPDISIKERVSVWKNTIIKLNQYDTVGFKDCTDVGLLIWLTEAIGSGYFNGWEKIFDLHRRVKIYFMKIARGENPVQMEAVAAKRLAVNDIVIHDKYGRGIVRKENSISKISEIEFDDGHYGKFQQLRPVLSHFKFMGVHNAGTTKGLKESVECSLRGYDEWLRALEVLRRHRGMFDEEIYGLAFDLIISHLGLKAKFVSDRLNEKGWKVDG